MGERACLKNGNWSRCRAVEPSLSGLTNSITSTHEAQGSLWKEPSPSRHTNDISSTHKAQGSIWKRSPVPVATQTTSPLHIRLRYHCGRRGRQLRGRGARSLLWGCSLLMSEATLRKSCQHGYRNTSWARTTITSMLKRTKERPWDINPTQKVTGN